MASTPSQQWPRGAHLVTSRRNKGNNKSQLRVSPTDRPPRYHKYRPPRKLPNICLSGWQLPSRLAPHRTFQLAIVALPADRFRFLLVGRFRYKNMRALTGFEYSYTILICWLWNPLLPLTPAKRDEIWWQMECSCFAGAIRNGEVATSARARPSMLKYGNVSLPMPTRRYIRDEAHQSRLIGRWWAARLNECPNISEWWTIGGPAGGSRDSQARTIMLVQSDISDKWLFHSSSQRTRKLGALFSFQHVTLQNSTIGLIKSLIVSPSRDWSIGWL